MLLIEEYGCLPPVRDAIDAEKVDSSARGFPYWPTSLPAWCPAIEDARAIHGRIVDTELGSSLTPPLD